MLKTAGHASRSARWTHRHALERQLGLPQGLLPCRSQRHGSWIARAAAVTGLNFATLERLMRMLALTVADCLKKIDATRQLRITRRNRER